MPATGMHPREPTTWRWIEDSLVRTDGVRVARAGGDEANYVWVALHPDGRRIEIEAPSPRSAASEVDEFWPRED